MRNRPVRTPAHADLPFEPAVLQAAPVVECQERLHETADHQVPKGRFSQSVNIAQQSLLLESFKGDQHG